MGKDTRLSRRADDGTLPFRPIPVCSPSAPALPSAPFDHRARRLDGAPDSTAKPARNLRVSMAHKTVQFIIGQILTDEALRAQFLDEPIETLSALRDSGFDLTNAEIDALGGTDRRLWTSGAQWIDARLQRCDLGSGGRD